MTPQRGCGPWPHFVWFMWEFPNARIPNIEPKLVGLREQDAHKFNPQSMQTAIQLLQLIISALELPYITPKPL